ncbi:hypothetical protein BO71DRAFT_489581 [Aspergillus ellipticus CBS 707.79]|uniref:C2H2-type domain-containing protein n=1 Tax=Aspergillus ellipticus CBS 707.79 TaxID=1448320 RepID=A0A319CPY0_9EURO|nr:hypothetical protein BO71DRAFT_489581 [Aspergillus ellipticus CBS 707.79]
MDCPTGSFSNSPIIHSPSEDQTMLDTPPAHSSPVHTVSPYECSFQSFSGLGISHCEAEASTDQLRFYPSPEPYVLSTSDWSDPIMPSSTLLDSSPDAGHFPPSTYYGPFNSRADVPVSPLSFYSSQALSASPGYDPIMDFSAMRNEVSQFWPSPPPETLAAPEGQTVIKDEPEDIWDSPLLDNASTLALGIMPQLPQLQISTAVPPQDDGTFTEAGANQAVTPDAVSAEAKSKWIRDGDGDKSPKNDKQFKIPSASGLECNVCGFRFTRRSNCREHMKRHDPRWRRSYPCSICGRGFGRKTDLKRHVDCIHYHVRKFGCEQCGQGYGRQDTLSRHKADGCPRGARKGRASKRPVKVPLPSKEDRSPSMN